MKNLILIFILVLVCETTLAFEHDGLWKFTKSGKYSVEAAKFYEIWVTGKKHLKGEYFPTEINMTGIQTPGDDTYVGIMAKTQISADLPHMLAILKNIKEYVSIYPDLDKVDLLKNEVSKIFTDQQIYWKFSGPLGTHTIYETIQRVIKIDDKRAALIYQLTKSDDVLDSDGFVFLEEDAKGKTKYLSVDFFNAKWGIAGTFFKDKIWSTTCENTSKATKALMQKAQISQLPGASAEKVLMKCPDMANRKTLEAFEKISSNILD
jgi:hypothetical protein